MLLYYEYGRMPPRPDRIDVVVDRARPHRSGKGREEWLTLVIGSKRQLRMRLVMYVPYEDGPHAVIVREEGRLGGTREVPMFLDAGYIFIEYARHDLDPDRDEAIGPAQEAYPDYDWATLAVWAWGGMRVVDYLETRKEADLKRIVITGHSRGGKMALLAAALDERFALAVPNGSGSGGAGAHRVLGPGAEACGMNDKPWWYHERMKFFGDNESALPFDQHFLKALIAPRALLCTESIDDEFANPHGSQVTSAAAMKAFRLYGAEKRNGIVFRRGKHDFNTEDWKNVLEFAEWQLFDRAPKDAARFQGAPFAIPSTLLPAGEHPGEIAEPEHDSVNLREPKRPASRFVKIEQASNAADENHYGRGAYGAVSYVYEIGEHQVTNEEYADFLDHVAASDPAELYHPRMSSDPRGGIVRRGANGSYRYLVKKALASQPVNYVSYFDALRYANWLHNARPRGPQGRATTEDGAYRLTKNGVPERRPGAKFFVTSEDEWYKAAYYEPKANRGRGRYLLMSPLGTGRPAITRPMPEWRSAYGVRQMANQTWEWNESRVGGLFRGIRSGAWFLGNNRQAAGQFFINPEFELVNVGFRIAKMSP